MSERNPRLIAEVLMAQFGAAALSHARQRLDELRLEHDASAEQVWVEIIGELIEMTEEIGRGRVH